MIETSCSRRRSYWWTVATLSLAFTFLLLHYAVGRVYGAAIIGYWIALVSWMIATPTVAGPVNGTAPRPVTNSEFARALGRALHRPALLPAPRVALKVVLGELADALLASQRALPGVALANGYHFRYPEIEIAFRGIYGE